MPRYRVVNSPTALNGDLHPVGSEVDYAGWPGSSLEPLDDVAMRVKAHFAAHRRNRKLERMPNLADFAEAPVEDQRRRRVKDEANG